VFVRIDASDAALRLSRQLGDVFPSEAVGFEWHVSESERFLGALILVEDGCTYVLVGQQGDGTYQWAASGHELSRDDAYRAMCERAQQFKLDLPPIG
jgi:hypothetical protein